MSRWVAHRATFICYHDGNTARARRAAAFESNAPLCPKCRLPMTLQDVAGLSVASHRRMLDARDKQIAALSRKDPS